MSRLLPDRILTDLIESEESYFRKSPNSQIKMFMDRLQELGFQFSVSNQVKQFMPKHKDIILPLAVQFYQQSNRENERSYFISLMRYPCCKSVVPMLLEAFYRGSDLDDREFISECIYSIHDKRYVEEYYKIITTEEFAQHRALFILLLGRWKYQKAANTIISLLEDPKLRTYAIIALGDYRDRAYEPIFMEYLNCDNAYWRRYAKRALEKLNRDQRNVSLDNI